MDSTSLIQLRELLESMTKVRDDHSQMLSAKESEVQFLKGKVSSMDFIVDVLDIRIKKLEAEQTNPLTGK